MTNHVFYFFLYLGKNLKVLNFFELNDFSGLKINKNINYNVFV